MVVSPCTKMPGLPWHVGAKGAKTYAATPGSSHLWIPQLPSEPAPCPTCTRILLLGRPRTVSYFIAHLPQSVPGPLGRPRMVPKIGIIKDPLFNYAKFQYPTKQFAQSLRRILKGCWGERKGSTRQLQKACTGLLKNLWRTRRRSTQAAQDF